MIKRNSTDDKKPESKGSLKVFGRLKHKFNIHLIMILLMVAVVAFIIIKLVIWDHSGRNVVMEEVEEGAYDYENLDVVFYVDQDILEQHGSDDINTILCIGNEFLTQKPYLVPSIGERISEVPDVETILLAAPGTRVTDSQNAYNNNNITYWQAGNLYDIVYALCNHDFSLQKKLSDTGNTITKEYYNTLTSVDMDKVDTLLIMYNSVDYREVATLYNPDDPLDTASYEGALRASITAIQDSYPHIRIIIASPYMHSVIVGNNVEPATLVNNGICNLSEYVNRLYNVSMEYCVSYIDNFYGVITENNMNDYANVDTLYVPGIKLISKHINEYLQRKY